MHTGILPGYAASHGCVRLPAEIAPLIYNKVKGHLKMEQPGHPRLRSSRSPAANRRSAPA